MQEKKIWTEITCAVSQVECILNMCEIDNEIHISLDFSFQFGGEILRFLNIKPV